MKSLFGTDGIRAIAGQFPLNYPSIYTLGHALVTLLKENRFEPKVLVGRDTRESGEWMEQALFQGIQDGQGEAVSAGIIPTSAISYLTKKHLFSAGIVISASHNPYMDNGIKIFSSTGIKISDEWEKRLEKEIIASQNEVRRKEEKITPSFNYLEDYLDFLKGQLSHLKQLERLKIVCDCSNGASSAIAPKIFSELGLEVEVIFNSPNGRNINDRCGSLYPQSLAKKVIQTRAVLGIAYDGDADRAIWVDEQGRILNGDHTLFVQARFMKEKGRLRQAKVVATKMSNLGLEKALEKMGISLLRTQVGDKYVLEEMLRVNANLGGERSGHTIFLDDCPTGDGILTSLKMLEAMVVSDQLISQLIKDYQEFPQVLINVPVTEKRDFGEFPQILKVMEDSQERLKEEGRLEVRYSGTEPVARVMVEGRDEKKIEEIAHRIAQVISRHLGS